MCGSTIVSKTSAEGSAEVEKTYISEAQLTIPSNAVPLQNGCAAYVVKRGRGEQKYRL
jgi:hypothetical protein